MAGKPAWMCATCWNGPVCAGCRRGQVPGTYRCACGEGGCRCLPHDEDGNVLAPGPGCLLFLAAVARLAVRA